MISLLIGYEAVTRFIWPVPISFNEAIPIAVLGLAVNIVSVLLLSGGVSITVTDHSHAVMTTITTKPIASKPTLALWPSK